MVKKRFFIGFNGILLALFLDICLLISIRTVDHHGHFQSATDKWETLLYILGLYFSFLLFEVIFYLILKNLSILVRAPPTVLPIIIIILYQIVRWIHPKP